MRYGSGDFSGNYSQTHELGDQNGSIQYSNYQHEIIPEPEINVTFFGVIKYGITAGFFIVLGLTMQVLYPDQMTPQNTDSAVSYPKE
tara:strand:- start:189 stop:449 length:261 start_codon:yes stop_codon:yes gene_type:complete